MNPCIRIATVNILNDLARWEERRQLLVRELAPLSLDLIALQEVTDPLGASTAHWLAAELGGYSVFVSPKTGRGRTREGVAILSRLPVERQAALDLGSQQRTAQFVQVRLGSWPLVVVNGHYYWPPGADAPRLRQVALLLDWLRAFPPNTPVIACGDYNGTPESRAIALMRRNFASAHVARQGREPDSTCPTPLVTGRPIRSAVARGLLWLFSNRPGAPWRGTLDYIFISPQLRVVECEVILDRPAPHDPGLYASDHYGLAATLEIAPDHQGPEPTASATTGEGTSEPATGRSVYR